MNDSVNIKNDNCELAYENRTFFSAESQNSLFQLEDESWWFQYRAIVITKLMHRYFDKKIKTIDIGGGNGYTTYIAMNQGFSVGLLEPSEAACKNARKRGIDAKVGTLNSNYPQDAEYEQVLLLDVLEHIEDDRGFLGLLYQKMSENGRLLIAVPAHMILWSSEDESAGHFRRYYKRQLCELLSDAGFDIIYRNYYMGFLFLPILIFRVLFEKTGLIKRKSQRSAEERKRIISKQFKSKSAIVNSVLCFFEMLEKVILKKQDSVLFGSSIIVVSQKRIQ